MHRRRALGRRPASSWRAGRSYAASSGRCDSGRRGAGPGQPPGGAPAAALDPREHRACPRSAALHEVGLRSTLARSASASSPRSTRLQIDTRAGSEVRRLSGGNQQKVVIARWLAGGFRDILCFDPTRGIDIGTKRQIYALLRELAASGAAVLLFTSELPEIALTCDRAVVLFGGRVVANLPVEQADETSLLRAAHGLGPQVEAAA